MIVLKIEIPLYEFKELSPEVQKKLAETLTLDYSTTIMRDYWKWKSGNSFFRFNIESYGIPKSIVGIEARKKKGWVKKMNKWLRKWGWDAAKRGGPYTIDGNYPKRMEIGHFVEIPESHEKETQTNQT